MSNRQARIARKRRQRTGQEACVHLKPTQRELAPIQTIDMHDGFRVVPHSSHREQKRRRFLYEQKTSGRRAGI